MDPEGKAGWQARVEPQIGWWVGWVETPTGAVIFALNIDLPGGMKDAPKREAIVRSILQSIEHFRASNMRVFMVHLTFVNRSPSAS